MGAGQAEASGLECADLDRVEIPGALRGAPADRCSYFKCYSLNNVGHRVSPSKILDPFSGWVGACLRHRGRPP